MKEIALEVGYTNSDNAKSQKAKLDLKKVVVVQNLKVEI